MTFAPSAHPHRLSPTPITFSYLSPPPLRHRSSEGRFSTRKFKETHFPHLKDQHAVCTPVKRIVRPSLPVAVRKTSEKTPEKHKVLKMNKAKSKRYSEQEREAVQGGDNTTPIDAFRMGRSQCDMVNSSHLRAEREFLGQIQLVETVQELTEPLRKV